MSNTIDDYEFIKLIQTYPVLYDKSISRGSKNATRKDIAWKEISTKVNASERACITRWKSIRDRFGKEFRRIQERPDEPIYWELFQHLLFLNDHYKHGLLKRETFDNIKFQPKERKRKAKIRWPDHLKKDRDIDIDIGLGDIETNQHLIAMVKDYPVLYDRQKIRDSKNLAAKNDAWRTISNSIGLPEEILYNRWKKLRERFSREYRNHQINSDIPITWIYFNDLMFLESHYRKGVPLNIETIKRPGRPRKHPANNNNDNGKLEASIQDVPVYLSTTDDDDMDEDDEADDETAEYDQYEDDELHVTPTEEMHNYLNLKSEQQLQQREVVLTSSIDDVQQQQMQKQQLLSNTDDEQQLIDEQDFSLCKVNVHEETAPAEKILSNVITNIETVLKQSQDCLKTLQEQTQRHQLELQTTIEATRNNNTFQPEANILRKAQMLLDDLSIDERHYAERKIIKFLCECQIKELNDEEIDDITPENTS